MTLFVEGGKGQFDGLGARGNDDVFSGDFGRFFAGHRDRVRILKTADPVVDVDVVFLHQEVNALAGDVDDGLLSGNHFFHIDHRGRAVNAMLGKAVNGVVVMFGRIQKRFGRNAAHIQAGSTQGRILLNNGGFHAQLRTANGANISTGTGTNNYDVVLHHLKFLNRTTKVIHALRIEVLNAARADGPKRSAKAGKKQRSPRPIKSPYCVKKGFLFMTVTRADARPVSSQFFHS